MSVTSAEFEKVASAETTHAIAFNATGNDAVWSDENTTFEVGNTSVHAGEDYSRYICITHNTPYASVDVAIRFHVCVSTVAILFGAVGNSLSVRVFTSQELRAASSHVYLLALAVSDNLYLAAVLLSEVLPQYSCLLGVNELAFINHSDAACRSLSFATSLLSNFSTLLILAFTFDRFFSCYQGIRYHQHVTSARARTCCVAILIVVMVTTAWYHVTMMGVQFGVSCSVYIKYETVFLRLHTAEMVAFKILPVICIVILNIFISVKLRRRHAKRTNRKSAHELQSLTTQTNPERSSSPQLRRKKQLESRNLQITIMLLVVSSAYVILFLPVLVQFLLWGVQRMDGYEDIISFETNLVLEYVASSLYIVGFAVNFFLYTVSCNQFREQLLVVVWRRKLSTAPTRRSVNARRTPANDVMKTTETQM